MTDEARLERLAALARKAWPQDACHVYGSSPRSTGSVMHDVEGQSAHVSVMAGDGSYLPLRIEHHPRALEALEAALYVLAGEPAPETCMRDCDGYWLQHKRADAEKARADAAEARLREVSLRFADGTVYDAIVDTMEKAECDDTHEWTAERVLDAVRLALAGAAKVPAGEVEP